MVLPDGTGRVAEPADERLHELYRGALGVYFGPFDEDFGYVTIEGFAAALAATNITDAELARRLSDAALIDQYNLLVFPVLLGAGKSLFGRADRDKHMLTLRESESYSNGILKLIYDVKR